MTGTFDIDPQDLAAVVPDCYAEFRPVVADGLTFFLKHLAPSRLAEVFAAQATLPADADLAHRLVLFLHACPALHKIGQVVARNRHLDGGLRRHLQELESLEPRTPAWVWRPILERELAPAISRYHIRIGERPLAEASVAIVVPLTWRDPSDAEGSTRRQGVAKVLKPGVVGRLDEDLAILGRLAAYMEDRWAQYHLPPLEYREVLDEVADLLAHEVLVPQEQASLRRAAEQYAGQCNLQVPRPLPFCTETLTAMERVHGRKVTDLRGMPAWRRPELFLAVVRSLLAKVVFTRDDTVLFHGDPHAGNLMATCDGRLALLDWSLTGRLTTDDRVQLAQILMGALALDPAKVAAAVLGLANDGADADLVRGQVATAVAGLRWGRPPGPVWAVNLLDTLARCGVRFPPRLLLFRKALLTLQGVLADLWPAGMLDETLMAEALVQFAWEWPVRLLRPPHDREYTTHVSSADLLQLAWRPVRQFCLPSLSGL